MPAVRKNDRVQVIGGADAGKVGRVLQVFPKKNRVLVEYALGGNTKPISVAEWETCLTHVLPAELQASLPTIEQIEAELAAVPKATRVEPGRKSRATSVDFATGPDRKRKP